ncbi:MAG TPA: DUF1579 family protein [Longimicrobium sp.]|jgi:hypothetical protein
MQDEKTVKAPFVSGLLKQRPTASEMLKKLDWLTGTWIIEGDYYTGDAHYPDRKAVFTFKWILGGMYLLWEMQSHGPLKFYENHALFSWDEEAEVYRGQYFDNFGTSDPTVMTWQDDNTLLMKYTRGFTFLGPAAKELRLTITRASDRKCRWLLEVRMEDNPNFQTLIEQRGEKLY